MQRRLGLKWSLPFGMLFVWTIICDPQRFGQPIALATRVACPTRLAGGLPPPPCWARTMPKAVLVEIR